ncbi:MAG: hypothetical protein HQL46_15315, partial [Gammaproteobacteria bacterium]|nr:hypothetical protein [Gammaproteobacteria bacterium]
YLDEAIKEKKTNLIEISNDILPRLMGKIFTYHNSNCHIDIGTLESYHLACAYAKENRL